ncbi:MAG TPA: ABC transporter permease, partial [Kiloniellales bacterium]
MIFGAFERMVAMRYLRARRQEGFVSVIAGFSLVGIALGVATLIIVMSVMNGFRQELLGRILGVNGHLAVYGVEGPFPDYQDVVARVHAIPGVRAVSPQVQGQVLVTASGTASGGLVRGVEPADLRARTEISGHIVAGSLDAFGGEDDSVVVVGSRLAQRLSIGVGDSLTVVSPQGT